VDRISKFEFGPHNINRHAVSPQIDLNTSALLLEHLQCRHGALTLLNDNVNTTDIAATTDIQCSIDYNLRARGRLTVLLFCLFSFDRM